MRRSIGIALVLGIVLGTTARASAQTYPEWDMFVSGGYANNRLTGGSDRLLGEDPRHGATAGIDFQLRLQDTYAIDAGIHYARKGGGGAIDSTFAVPNLKDVTTSVGEADVVLDYLEIPLLFSFIADAGESAYLRAYLGPCINVLARARVTGTASGKSIDQDIKNAMQSIMTAGMVGASYVYEMKTWRLIADANYSEGLSKVSDAGDMRIRGFSVSLGVGIPLAR